jgi:hypothetical protein
MQELDGEHGEAGEPNAEGGRRVIWTALKRWR